MGQVLEPRALGTEVELYAARRAVPVFRDDRLGEPAEVLLALPRAEVVLRPVHEDDDVSDCLEVAWLAQIRESRPAVRPSRRRPGELRGRDHRDVQLLRGLLEPPAKRADLLSPRLALALHVVDVVDDHETEIVCDLQPPGAGSALRYPGRRVVEVERRRVNAGSRVAELLVLVILDLAVH